MSWANLDTIEAAAGALFTDFQELRFPQRFGPLDREWRAVRQGAGLLDARNRSLLSMVGDDRATFLQGMLSNDILKISEGHGIYAALLTIQGRLVSDVFAYALPDRFLLDVPAWRMHAVRDALEKHIIADDVEFAEDAVTPLLALEGPRASDVLRTVSGESPAGLSPLDHRTLTIDGAEVRCVAVSQTGEIGFRLLAQPDAAPSLWQRLIAAGATPVGLEALNVLRLEAGIPWHGIDVDAETLVMEAGLAGAISFSKGCYLGQEVVERVAARGHVNRKLCGLVANDATLAPPAGSPLTRDGQEVGRISSAAVSPALRRTIALALVHRSAFEPGTVVQAEVGERHFTLTVTTLPFYRRPSANHPSDEEASHGKSAGQTLPV
jgi:folate-binding protein YgfZ